MIQHLRISDGFFGDDSFKISFFFSPSENPEKLIFFFPGAYDRSKGSVQFQRHSWVTDYSDKCHCFFLDDPTVNENNSLSIGWFQGWRGINLEEGLVELVNQASLLLGIEEKDIVFFGSSAGGFVSLKMSQSFRKATVIAINPQIYLNYFYPRLYNEMLAFSFPDASPDELARLVNENFCYNPLISYNTENNLGRVCIFQNRYDNFHLSNHLGLMIKKSDNKFPIEMFYLDKLEELGNYIPNGKLNIYYYNDAEMGHNPPNRMNTRAIIRKVIEFDF